MLRMAEINSGSSLKPNIPREPKLGYVLQLQRLEKTAGSAVGGKRLRDQFYVCLHDNSHELLRCTVSGHIS